MPRLKKRTGEPAYFFYVRVSPAEKRRIESSAKHQNYRSVAEFIRKTLLDSIESASSTT